MIHLPLGKAPSLEMGEPGEDAWLRAVSQDVVPVLGFCRVGPSRLLPDSSSSRKREEMRRPGLKCSPVQVCLRTTDLLTDEEHFVSVPLYQLKKGAVSR